MRPDLDAPRRRGTPDGWQPVLVRMPAELHEAIKNKAAAEERSMAQAIRHALRLYINGELDET